MKKVEEAVFEFMDWCEKHVFVGTCLIVVLFLSLFTNLILYVGPSSTEIELRSKIAEMQKAEQDKEFMGHCLTKYDQWQCEFMLKSLGNDTFPLMFDPKK